MSLDKPIDIKLSLDTSLAKVASEDLGYLHIFSRRLANQNVDSEHYGIDLLRAINTTSTDSADLMLSTDPEDYRRRMLIAGGKGGIIPIFNKKKIDLNRAPEKGYRTHYVLKGNEKGFFVKCRNGRAYARLDIFSAEFKASTALGHTYAIDKGMMFHALLQRDGRYFSTAKDFSMKYYLIDNL